MKRYDLVICEGYGPKCDAHMEESKYGDYVEWDDYEELFRLAEECAFELRQKLGFGPLTKLEKLLYEQSLPNLFQGNKR